MQMGVTHLHFCLICFIILVAICYAQDPAYICSRATYIGSPKCIGNPRGACGYGEYGSIVNNGAVGGVSRLYRNGSGCGACYQIRCKIPTLCSEDGTTIVVIDFGVGSNADFVLSKRGYANMALPKKACEFYTYGVVAIEYRRIPCHYGNKLMLKVHEHSYYPDYLAIIPLYQDGVYDIIAAEIWLEDCKEWQPMRQAFGLVWDKANPPRGAINVRLQVTNTATGEVKWVQIIGAIPNEWTPGVAYDTGIQLE